MTRRNEQRSGARAAGFTLLEVLVASTISSVLIVAIYVVFHGALSLRESANERLNGIFPRAYASQTLRRDFHAVTPPSGILAGPLLGERGEEGALRTDSLEFYTASAAVAEGEPWGDIQKVEYRLSEDDSSGTEEGSDLIRVVTRNLLATTAEEPPEQRLLSGVESLEFSYYYGDIWEESWDSTNRLDEPPQAIRIRIDFASRGDGALRAKPLEIVIEVTQVPVEIVLMAAPNDSSDGEEADTGAASAVRQSASGGDPR